MDAPMENTAQGNAAADKYSAIVFTGTAIGSGKENPTRFAVIPSITALKIGFLNSTVTVFNDRSARDPDCLSANSVVTKNNTAACVETMMNRGTMAASGSAAKTSGMPIRMTLL